VNEDELIDKHGQFIIFKNKESKVSEIYDETNASSEVDPNLESNFSKLNYINKINILLKALMIERNKNRESHIYIDIMKKEYISKV
jgi:hypothetical protein